MATSLSYSTQAVQEGFSVVKTSSQAVTIGASTITQVVGSYDTVPSPYITSQPPYVPRGVGTFDDTVFVLKPYASGIENLVTSPNSGVWTVQETGDYIITADVNLSSVPQASTDSIEVAIVCQNNFPVAPYDGVTLQFTPTPVKLVSSGSVSITSTIEYYSFSMSNIVRLNAGLKVFIRVLPSITAGGSVTVNRASFSAKRFA